MVKLRVKEAARERGLKNPYQLMRAMAVPPSQPYRLWRGDLTKIGLGTINDLCNALNCQPGELFSFVPDKIPKKRG